MTTKHTPGPWHITGPAFSAISPNITEHDQSPQFGPKGPLNGGFAICTIHGTDAPANARLLVAAPEMLEALKFQEMADADPASARAKGYYETAARMRRAAIAKAEGE